MRILLYVFLLTLIFQSFVLGEIKEAELLSNISITKGCRRPFLLYAKNNSAWLYNPISSSLILIDLEEKKIKLSIESRRPVVSSNMFITSKTAYPNYRRTRKNIKEWKKDVHHTVTGYDNRTGRAVWQIKNHQGPNPFGTRRRYDICYSDLIFVKNDKKFLRVDPNTGEFLWSIDYPPRCYHIEYLSNHFIFFVRERNESTSLFIYDISGMLKCTLHTFSAFDGINSSVTIMNDIIYIFYFPLETSGKMTISKHICVTSKNMATREKVTKKIPIESYVFSEMDNDTLLELELIVDIKPYPIQNEYLILKEIYRKNIDRLRPIGITRISRIHPINLKTIWQHSSYPIVEGNTMRQECNYIILGKILLRKYDREAMPISVQTGKNLLSKNIRDIRFKGINGTLLGISHRDKKSWTVTQYRDDYSCKFKYLMRLPNKLKISPYNLYNSSTFTKDKFIIYSGGKLIVFKRPFDE